MSSDEHRFFLVILSVAEGSNKRDLSTALSHMAELRSRWQYTYKRCSETKKRPRLRRVQRSEHIYKLETAGVVSPSGLISVVS